MFYGGQRIFFASTNSSLTIERVTTQALVQATFPLMSPDAVNSMRAADSEQQGAGIAVSGSSFDRSSGCSLRLSDVVLRFSSVVPRSSTESNMSYGRTIPVYTSSWRNGVDVLRFFNPLYGIVLRQIGSLSTGLVVSIVGCELHNGDIAPLAHCRIDAMNCALRILGNRLQNGSVALLASGQRNITFEESFSFENNAMGAIIDLSGNNVRDGDVQIAAFSFYGNVKYQRLGERLHHS